jgi:hypothetical protein
MTMVFVSTLIGIYMHAYYSCICMHDYKLFLWCDLYINMCIAHVKIFIYFTLGKHFQPVGFFSKTSVTG